MPLTIRQIQYFVSTAETGKIADAAAALNISQSAITIAIRQLENDLGVTLFNRRSDGMALTYAGKDFLRHCYDILTSVNSAMNIRHWDNELSGSIHLAATYTVMAYYLPTRFQAFCSRYPSIRIHLHELSRPEIEAGLLDGSLDLAVLLSSNVQNEHIYIQPLHNSRRTLWLPNNHPLSRKNRVSLADIEHEPYIMLTFDEADKAALLYWQSQRKRANILLETMSIETVRNMVGNGSGIAILSDMVYRPWTLDRRRINRIPLSPEPPAMKLGLAWAQHRSQTAIEKLFCDYMVQQADAPR